MEKNKQALVQIKDLKKYFQIKGKGSLHAVDGVSFEIFPGETVGLVGESGCGKSTIGNVLMRLYEPTSGQMLFDGRDVFSLNGKEMREIRKKMQIIFQDPYSSLNPKKRIWNILAESFMIHGIKEGRRLEERIREVCMMTGIEEDLIDCFPHELDGGKRQVVGIARALSLNPSFIVCDEPVSSLDVSVQAKIINLLMDIQRKTGVSYLFISHDLSVVRHISDRIAVMYLGQIVETAPTDELFANTIHPYSIALLSAVPKVDVNQKVSRIVLKGDVPSPINPKPGCRFAPRCWMAEEDCFEESPDLKEMCPGHCVACHHADQSIERSRTAVKTSIE